ncbi:hypothetical protein XENTR_v10003989 [Xenopus tropicalis]|uniref:Caspase recruitment domain family member 14 n=1 Tax=Xenopus tropicalis TaxID=8364 RepID=F7CRQ3_XENTR|nr:caspase recruitment domain-containing protein 14 [Xenopus tropicalis]XP_012808377.1 caspase recruitment domain-containing protein 14 [Xenopus tropicalis]XP_012808378.1 caspase recruitment domain-containing protein 14 [Xenopus tropicalis]KAE8575930.1 hypothetical protein XENTR_v10003989 [Xenopus tropicalis]KAE8575931.1 hypothetical protein XENTR_v10003989 [Xenopus tropicalis]KAE8575932.1 hypothetical protein XENTR_v10003989 [Xenopus tropicalis]KAE8575933.1 hypothetical protein XENTR_v100039|eukprot:XP_002937355.2 PREDICTED: caspase recruitment domain-containing protein 14 [Xenopus tropicalis]
MSAQWKADPELMDKEEEELWEMIERHRCKIVQRLSPERLTPYLRQARVLDEMDEEEVLHCAKFSTRAMKMGRLLDLLRTRSKNGAIAFLDSLILTNPRIYTLITGKEASMDPNSFSKLIDSNQLSIYLMQTLSNLHEELMQEKQVKSSLMHHLRKMREKQQQLEEEGESVRSMEHENQRLRREKDAQSQLLSKLKDEQYELSMRYSHALQEKDTVQSKNSELQEQFYAMREELNRLRMDLQVSKSWTTHAQCEEELLCLREENRQLRDRPTQEELGTLEEQQPLDVTLQGNQELLAQLRLSKEKLAASEAVEKLWEKEKDTMVQERHNLQLECDILRKKSEAFHSHVCELKKERDQAYRARDMVQTEISTILAEKDSLRQQVMELTDRNSELLQQILSLQEQLQTQREMRGSLHACEQRDVSTKSKHMRLVRMYAVCPSEEGSRSLSSSISETWTENSCQTSSDLGESFNSYAPPHDDYLTDLTKSASQDLPDLLQTEKTETDSEYEEGLPMFSQMQSSESCSSYNNLAISVPRRRHACRDTSRVTVIAFQGDDLLKQISIIGGNRTGIFIHRVTEGSAADEMSLRPGYQIIAVDFDVLNPSYKVALEGMTSEDAHCILNRVNGFCCLSVKCNKDEYRKLLRDIESGSVSSGDSFYVQVNQSMAGRVGGGLQVTCGEILHITDTMYKGSYQWFAHRVNAYTMKDGESGIIPNYPQAQQQLITTIQHLTWQNGTPRRPQKQIRIVSTDRCNSHLLWTSLDCGICQCEDPPAGSVLGTSCFTLLPYTLVTHLKTVIPRPVLLVPSLLGRILSEKLCSSKDFIKCDTEYLTDAEYSARYLRGDIIGEKEREDVRCCFTRQNVESVAKQNAHCILELGLSCLSALLRVGIYPIILHIPLTEKSTKKLKKPLQWWRNCEDLLMECSQREEAELDSLPCLYHTIDPDSWSDTESLLCSVKEAILDEQKRIVWLEKKTC